jgi:hypothetical protein
MDRPRGLDDIAALILGTIVACNQLPAPRIDGTLRSLLLWQRAVFQVHARDPIVEFVDDRRSACRPVVQNRGRGKCVWGRPKSACWLISVLTVTRSSLIRRTH